METKTLRLASSIILLTRLTISAQEMPFVPMENTASNPCISEQEYKTIEKRCLDNIKLLKLENHNKGNTTVLSVWPVQAAANMHDCSVYHISAYVDHDANAGAIKDFDCGNNTYDGHRGTDISSWPYNFYKMDNNLVEVHAAADGTIIDVHDGEFDRNCSGNQLTANYVILQHADGSVALYWHMKKGQVTTKTVGQTVVAGEKLGIVGSSGSSSGPHLHFEVWAGNTVATRIDPFAGQCNSLNATSWWAAQKAHKETSIMKASVNSTDVLMPGCPTTETSNESNSFPIPFQGAGLPANYAKFYIFLRDEVTGTMADCKILNPNGSTYLSWTYTSSADNKTLYWGWSKKLPATAGLYTFQATYNGTTSSSTFQVGQAQTGSIEEEQHTQLRIFPNPSTGIFVFESTENEFESLEIFDIFGKIVYKTEIFSPKTEINLQESNGLYFYTVTGKNGKKLTGKLILKA